MCDLVEEDRLTRNNAIGATYLRSWVQSNIPECTRVPRPPCFTQSFCMELFVPRFLCGYGHNLKMIPLSPSRNCDFHKRYVVAGIKKPGVIRSLTQTAMLAPSQIFLLATLLVWIFLRGIFQNNCNFRT